MRRCFPPLFLIVVQRLEPVFTQIRNDINMLIKVADVFLGFQACLCEAMPVEMYSFNLVLVKRFQVYPFPSYSNCSSCSPAVSLSGLVSQCVCVSVHV